MIPIGKIIEYGLGAVQQFFGWKREEAARQNTPEMQANAKGAQDAKVIDDARKAVAEGDTDAIRKGLS